MKKINLVLMSFLFTIFFVGTASAISDALIISEICYLPEGGGVSGQFIELYNTSSEAIDLTESEITIQASGRGSWTGGGSVSFKLSDYITPANTLIAAGGYFLISNAVEVTFGGVTKMPNVYIDDKVKILAKPSDNMAYPARGVRIIDNEGNIVDSLLYGSHKFSFTNTAMLQSAGYVSGSTDINTSTVNIDSMGNGNSISRKVLSDNDGGSPEWEVIASPTPVAGDMLPNSATNFSIGMVNGEPMISWTTVYKSGVIIYWTDDIVNGTWNAVDGDALNDLTTYGAQDFVVWVDTNSSPGMPADFSTVAKRYYKLEAY